MQDLETLNRLFGKKAGVCFIEGQTGMPIIKVSTRKASATIALYGGQILSYKSNDMEQDLFYLSEKAIYQQGKAIRGGVPVCWPWFGEDPSNLGRQAHGFARNLLWSVLDCQLHDDIVEITLGLESTATSKQWWPNEFRLRKKIVIGEHLQISLTTENRGEIPFSISKALHSYFQVGDISKITVVGLDGLEYLDKTLGFSKRTQVRDLTPFAETDRVYLKSPECVWIIDDSLKRQIKIEQNGAENIVVWNPWTRASLFNDMDADDYHRFICVETANALANSVIIAPGSSHQMQAKYKIAMLA